MEWISRGQGVRRKPGVLRCAGRAEIAISGHIYRLEDFAPTAYLPESWAGAWVDALSTGTVRRLTTIENELPFLSYVEESGGPQGLGVRGEVVVYTAGFPGSVLIDSLVALASRNPAIRFQHSGEPTVGGLRIWWFLRSRLDRPVYLFPTRAQWLAEAANRGEGSLGDLERSAIQRLRDQFLASACATDADVKDAVRLADALLGHGVNVVHERS